MALPSVDLYRSQVPDDPRSDDEIALLLTEEASRAGRLQEFPDLAGVAQQLSQFNRPAFQQAVQPSVGQEFGQGLARGTDVAQAQLYSTAAQAGQLVGSETLAQFGQQGYERNIQEAAESPATVPTIEDVDSPEAAARFLFGLVGSQVPQIGATLASGAAGGLIGSAVQPGAGTLGGIVGGAIMGYTQMQNYSDLVNSGVEPGDALVASVPVGVLGAALETITPVKVLSKFFPGAAKKEAAKYIGGVLESVEPSLKREIIKATIENAGTESMTEVTQELVTMAGELYAHRNDPEFSLDPKEVRSRILNSGLAGAILGGALGPIEGVAAYNQQPEAGAPPPVTPAPAPVTPPPPAPAPQRITTVVPAPSPFDTEVLEPTGPMTFDETGFLTKEEEAFDTTVLEPAGPMELPDEEPVVTAAQKTFGPTGVPAMDNYAYSDQELRAATDEAMNIALGRDPNAPTVTPRRAEQLPIQTLTDLYNAWSSYRTKLTERTESPNKALPALSEPFVDIDSGTTPAEIRELARKGMASRGETRAETRRLIAYLDRKTDEFIVTGVQASSQGEPRVQTGVGITRDDLAKFFTQLTGAEVSASTINRYATESVPTQNPTAEMVRMLRDDLELQEQGLSLDEFIAAKLPDNEPRFVIVGFAMTANPVAHLNIHYPTAEDFLTDRFAKEKPVEDLRNIEASKIEADRKEREVFAKLASLDDGRYQLTVNTIAATLEAVASRANLTYQSPLVNALLGVGRTTKFARKLAGVTRPEELLALKGRMIGGIIRPSAFSNMLNLAAQFNAATEREAREEIFKQLRLFIESEIQANFARSDDPLYDAARVLVDTINNRRLAPTSLDVARETGAETDGEETTAEEPDFTDVEREDALIKDEGMWTDIHNNPEFMMAYPKVLAAISRTAAGAARSLVQQRALTVERVLGSKEFRDHEPILRRAAEMTAGKVAQRAGLTFDPATLTPEQLAIIFLKQDIRFSRAVETSYRTTGAEVTAEFNRVMHVLNGYGIPVELLEQNANSDVEFVRKGWAAAFPDQDGAIRVIRIAMANMREPSLHNLRQLLHEAAHAFIRTTPKAEQRAIHDAIARLGRLQQEVFSQSLDARIRAGNPAGLEPYAFLEEVLAEHLAFEGVNPAPGLIQGIINFVRSILGRAALSISNVMGTSVAPGLVESYVRQRFTDFLDGRMRSEDFDSFAGIARRTQRAQALNFDQETEFTPAEQYDFENGVLTTGEVVDDSTSATNFNIDRAQALFGNLAHKEPVGSQPDWSGLGLGVAQSLDAEQVLNNMLAVTQNPQHAQLMRWLRTNKLVKRAVINSNQSDFDAVASKESRHGDALNRVRGYYISGTSPRILLNRRAMNRRTAADAEATILHELMHSAGYAINGLVKSPSLVDQNKLLSIDDLRPEVLDFLSREEVLQLLRSTNDLRKIFFYLRTARGETLEEVMYSGVNFDEFVAQVFTNPRLQAVLKETKIPSHIKNSLSEDFNGKSMFEILVNWFIELFESLGADNALGISSRALGNFLEQIARSYDVAPQQQAALYAQAEPTARVTIGTAEPAVSDAPLKFQLEKKAALFNETIAIYEKLFGTEAQKLGKSVREYITKILGMRDIYASKEAVELRAGEFRRRDLVFTINLDRRIDSFDSVTQGELNRKLLINTGAAMNKMSARQARMKSELKSLERQVEREKNAAKNFDTRLNDLQEYQREANRQLRQQLNKISRDLGRALAPNRKLSGPGSVLAKLLNLQNGQVLSREYETLMSRIINENSQSLEFVDLMSAFAKANVDFMAKEPLEIEADLLQTFATSQDPKLRELLRGDPLSKTQLAAVIHIAKTNPMLIWGLSLRTAKLESKVPAMKSIQEIIQGTSRDLRQLDQLIKTKQIGRDVVTKIKVSLRKAQKRFAKVNDELVYTQTAIDAMGNAMNGIQSETAPFRRAIQIQPPVFRGGPDALGYNARPGVSEAALIEEGPKKIKLSDAADVWRNNRKWLIENRHQQTEFYGLIKEQQEQLTHWLGSDIKMGFVDRFYDIALLPISDRFRRFGNKTAHAIAARFTDFSAKKYSAEQARVQGYKVAGALKAAMDALEIDRLDAFKQLIHNPANRFIETSNYLLSPDRTKAENAQVLKQALFSHLQGNEQLRERLTTTNYDLIWNFLITNYDAAKLVADTAAKWKVLVEDEDVKVFDPRTGKYVIGYRPALDIGLFTAQRTTKNMEVVTELLNRLGWANLLVDEREAVTPEFVAKYLPAEVVELFVKPFVYDGSYTHFPAPRIFPLDEANFANPALVRRAWEESNGDITLFPARLYQLEMSLSDAEFAEVMGTPDGQSAIAQYQEDLMTTLIARYKLMKNMTDEWKNRNDLGVHGIEHQVMDNRKGDELPAEFLDYRVYDPTTLHVMMNELAMHSAFGRNLGLTKTSSEANTGLFWEIEALREELAHESAAIKARGDLIKFRNPGLSHNALRKILKKELGDDFQLYDKADRAFADLKRLAQDVLTTLAAPGNGTKEATLPLEIVNTLASFVVNNFKSALIQIQPLFDPFLSLKLGKSSGRAVLRGWQSFLGSGAGSFAQAFGVQIQNASKYAQLRNRLGLNQDIANYVKIREILADRGMEGNFETERVLGFIRRGRSALLNVGVGRGTMYPKLKPLAPFNSTVLAVNNGLIDGYLQMANVLISEAVKLDTPALFDDPNFQFTADQFGLKKLEFDEIRAKFERIGTTFEIEVIRAKDALQGAGLTNGDVILHDELVQKLAWLAMEEISLNSDITTTPSWLTANAGARLISPLLKWPIMRLNQLRKTFKTPEGQHQWAAARAGIAAMLFAIVPAAVVFSILTDEYDEEILGRKSNLASFNLNGTLGENAVALVERLGRMGTFGMAGDVVNGIRVYGTDGDLRGLSFDQRVLFANSVLTAMGLVSTVIHQEGDLTYSSFYRPLMSALGGNGFIQDAQILNNMSTMLIDKPVFSPEYRYTARLNAINYIRSAGRVLDLNVRTGAGVRSLPTPIKPWIDNMVLAAYTNDRQEFQEAYKLAIAAAKDEGKDDPVEYVKRSFSTRHPLRYVFLTPPSAQEYKEILRVSGADGARDVEEAVRFFNIYGQSLGLKPYFGKEPKKVTGKGLQATPSAFSWDE